MNPEKRTRCTVMAHVRDGSAVVVERFSRSGGEPHYRIRIGDDLTLFLSPPMLAELADQCSRAIEGGTVHV